MQTNAPIARKLRFPLELYPDESIPGALARATRSHVLVSTTTVLHAAGIRLNRPGLVQLASHDDLKRLADVICCPADDLIARSGQRILPQGKKRCVKARIGATEIPRNFLELNRRRIAPRSLSARPYHRLNWLNLLFPYCPESLEPMVDQCKPCGAILRWRHAFGIDRCEECGEIVAPSDAPPLPSELASSYRLGASILSLSRSEAATTRIKIKGGIEKMHPASLLKLLINIGSLATGSSRYTRNINDIIRLPPPILASIIAHGAELIGGWPSSLRNFFFSKIKALNASNEEIIPLWQDLKDLSSPNKKSVDLAKAVTSAIPELSKRPIHAFAGTDKYYLCQDVQSRLGINASHMSSLRKWPDLRMRRVQSKSRTLGTYNAEQIDSLTPIFRDLTTVEAASQRLGLPHYAIEAMCKGSTLEHEDHPAVSYTFASPRLRKHAVNDLRRQIQESSSSKSRRDDCVALSVAVKRIGGRQKPWNAIIRALLERKIPYWLEGQEASPTSIFVIPEDITPFDHIFDFPGDSDTLKSKIIRQTDMFDVLNVIHRHLPELISELGVKFEKSGRGLVTSLPNILKIAYEIAWPAEISWHLGTQINHVAPILLHSGISPRCTGWSRPQLIAKGILPNPSSNFTKTDCAENN